jgi:hypothetical protein
MSGIKEMRSTGHTFRAGGAFQVLQGPSHAHPGGVMDTASSYTWSHMKVALACVHAPLPLLCWSVGVDVQRGRGGRGRQGERSSARPQARCSGGSGEWGLQNTGRDAEDVTISGTPCARRLLFVSSCPIYLVFGLLCSVMHRKLIIIVHQPHQSISTPFQSV